MNHNTLPNTYHRGAATLPPPSNPVVEDQKTRAASDPQQCLVPEPFQSIPAQDLLKDNCGKCGWIRKEGGSIKSWHDRYVILHKGCLYYYTSPEAKATAGKFSLGGYRLSPAPEKNAKFTWTFKLVHMQPEKRTYYFAAYSEREMNEWTENLVKEMEEYCGVAKQNTSESSELLEGPEYCYPEVEPRFEPDEIAALFGRASPNLPKKPQSEPMYHPPPQFDSKDLVPKKSPILPRPGMPRKTPDFPKGCSLPVRIDNGAVRHGGSPLKPMKPMPGLSPVLPSNPMMIPVVPSRAAKPLLATDSTPSTARSPKTKPKPLPRPSPVQKNTFHCISTYGAASQDQDDEEYSEGYLDIVPDSSPQDMLDRKDKPSYLRGHPDGKDNEHEIPCCTPVDMNKAEVNRVLENKLGVYILRKSENAQSKRALSVWTGDRVRHYLIFHDEERGFTLDPKDSEVIYFKRIEHLLLHYYKNDLPNCDVKLVKQFK